MSPTTWEEAAHEAAETFKPNWGSICSDRLGSIERHLKHLRDGTGYDEGEFHRADTFAMIAALAIHEADGEFEDVRANVIATIISKQHDYGHENILWAGRDGLIVRMHDKVARIKNLQKRIAALVPGQALPSPLNESLADSWLDIAGYAIIGIMLERGTFELPLAADVPVGNPFTFTEWQKNNSLANDDTIAKSAWVPASSEFVDDFVHLELPETPLFDDAEEARIEEIATDTFRNLLGDGELTPNDERQIKGWINEAILNHVQTYKHVATWIAPYVQPSQPNAAAAWPLPRPWTSF